MKSLRSVRTYKRRYHLEYTVEVVPGESEAPIKSVLYYDDSSWVCQDMAEIMRGEEELGASMKKKSPLLLGEVLNSPLSHLNSLRKMCNFNSILNFILQF